MGAAPSTSLGSSAGIAAAMTAVAAAEVAALGGMVQGRLAYTLTYNMIKQNQGALSFPLIALSFAAITAGLLAYTQTQAAAELAKAATLEQFQAAVRRLEAERA